MLICIYIYICLDTVETLQTNIYIKCVLCIHRFRSDKIRQNVPSSNIFHLLSFIFISKIKKINKIKSKHLSFFSKVLALKVDLVIFMLLYTARISWTPTMAFTDVYTADVVDFFAAVRFLSTIIISALLDTKEGSPCAHVYSFVAVCKTFYGIWDYMYIELYASQRVISINMYFVLHACVMKVTTIESHHTYKS